MFAGTPCKCGWPQEKTPERPEVSSSEWIDALTTALRYWIKNADAQRKDRKTLDVRSDYEGQVFRRCKAVLSNAHIGAVAPAAKEYNALISREGGSELSKQTEGTR